MCTLAQDHEGPFEILDIHRHPSLLRDKHAKTMRYLAGSRLTDGEGAVIGALYVRDGDARANGLSTLQRSGLEVAVRAVEADLDTLRHTRREHQQARKVAHRIGNLFAVITGLITLRSRGKAGVEPFADKLAATVLALGKAQEFVTSGDGQESDQLKGLIAALLEAGAGNATGKIAISGDDAAVGPSQATPLALIIHELCANALAHGALSDPDGTLAVEVRRSEHNVQIHWRESGGPRVSEPQHTGVGLRYVTLAARTQLGGAIALDWPPQGLVLTMDFPLAKLSPAPKAL